MAPKITTEIVSIDSSKGNDAKAIDLNDTVVVRNIIDGKTQISRGVKVEWLFGGVSNYFLDNSVSDEKRVQMLVQQAARQNMPSTVNKEVQDYLKRYRGP